MTTKASYITFDEAGWSASGKTRLWHVSEREDRGVIGTVHWYAAWRKYAFSPNVRTVFEEVCLHEIAEFCETKTREHRSQRGHQEEVQP